MPKNTPGPWRQGKTGGCVVADSSHATHLDQEYYGGNLVAESIHAPNIPIIAAAPTLLAALRKLSTRLRDAGRLTPDLIEAEAIIAELSPVEGGTVCPVCKACIQATRHVATYYTLTEDQWGSAGKGNTVDLTYYCENDHDEEDWDPTFVAKLHRFQGITIKPITG